MHNNFETSKYLQLKYEILVNIICIRELLIEAMTHTSHLFKWLQHNRCNSDFWQACPATRMLMLC